MREYLAHSIITLLIGIILCNPTELSAQELEPRILAAVPLKGNFTAFGYGYSSGNILLDNSLPIEDLRAELHSFIAGYSRSFKLFNRLTKASILVPASFVTLRAIVEGVDTSANRDGLGDIQLKTSMILIGVQPAELPDFPTAERRNFRLGVQVAVRAPTGKYDNTKLINLGTNRWGFKLGVAAVLVFNSKWFWEAQVNSWSFTQNNDFNGGNTLKQKFLLSFQTHVTYLINTNMWLAAGVGSNHLGETELNGEGQNNQQEAVRYGASYAVRFGNRHGLKLTFSNALVSRQGADFTTLALSYQYLWFDGVKRNRQ